MAIVFRWTILVVAFLFLALLYGISKEIFPPSFLAGAIRGILIVLIMTFVWNITKKIGNKEKDGQERKLFSAKYQPKEDITSNAQDMIAKGRTTQLQKEMPSERTIENKVISKEKAILEELRNEGILTANEFIEKMAVVEAREEAERFEKLLCSTTEPFINKISELKNAGLLNKQEYEQKKHKIIEKHRAELLDEQEQKKCPKCGMENRIQKISVGFIQKCDECGNIDYFKEKPIGETSWRNRVL